MKQALLYSGGVESTLLYYTLLQKATASGALDLFIVDRYNKPIQKAQTLYYILQQSFNDNFSTCQILNAPLYLNNTDRMLWAVRELSVYYDEVYWGINAYPDHIKPKADVFKNPDRKQQNYPALRFPYLNMTKDQIINQYRKYNITWILEYTHSCGEPGTDPCGKCFNCQEREWAYKQLNMTLHRGT